MIRNTWRIAAALAVLGIVAVPASAQSRGRLTWSGDVDNTAIVYIHGRNMQTKTVSGHSTTNARLFGRLPQRTRHVSLERERGRGRVRLVQQPNRSNDFTAGVRIRDPQAGRSHYEFVLAW